MQKLNIHDVPLAVGEFVILETSAPTVEQIQDEVTASGIIIKQANPDFSKAIPKFGVVVSKGTLVPDSEISIGDIVNFPNGHCYNIEDPRIINGDDVSKENRRQFCYTHWKNIGAKFINKGN